MNIETINMGAYNLHFIKTKKFKTINIEVDFYREISNEEVFKRNLLEMVLLESNKNYKSEKDFIIACEELYGISIGSSLYRVGKFSNLCFRTSFLNEKFTEVGMNKESILFFLDILFNPNVKDNAFIDIDRQKKKLKQQILSAKDNKINYAITSTLGKIKDMPYSYVEWEHLDLLDEITPSDLYDYYNRVLKEDQIDIFVLGDFDSSIIRDIFKEYFRVTTFKKSNRNLLIDQLPIRKRMVRYREYDNINQSQVVVVCNLSSLSDFERRYTIKLYNEILGGYSNSLLFSTIREKYNYCYFVYSSLRAFDNILYINLGTQKENVEKSIKLIKRVMKNIREGKFDDNIINSSRNTLISGIKASQDKPASIIGNVFSHFLVGTEDENVRIDNYNKISKDDIIRVSKKVNIYTAFTLESEDDE